MLDLTTILEALQAISGELVLGRLLDSLIQLLIEDTGAEQGCVILEADGKLTIEAAGPARKTRRRARPILLAEHSDRLSAAMVRHVIDSGERVVWCEAGEDGSFSRDPYLLAQQPQSVLCIPLVYQGQVRGALYVENHASTDAFGPERVQLLSLLATQAAISIENAKLYSTLEQKVSERTSALRTTNERLRGTNLRLTYEIEERRQAEAALRESEARFRHLFDNMSSGVAVYEARDRGQDFVLVGLNRAAERINQVAREDALGRSVLELFPGVKRFGLYQVFQRVWRTGEPEHHPMSQYKDKRIAGWLENYVYKLPSGEIVAIHDDVTRRKQAEEELWLAKEAAEQARSEAEQARAAAESANQAKSRFLANTSHELRTPLNAILGFSQLMARDPRLAPELRDNLDTIVHSSEHLLALINDILELSKIEAGRVELQSAGFDLWLMLAGLVEMLGQRAEAKGLNLAFERSPDVPQYIRADASKLRQVLINLVGNAIKFTAEGTITLRVYESSRPEGEPGRRLCFEVEDSGPGIEAEELDLLFEPFVQTQSGRSAHEGTGLGLPISRNYVRMMGGDIRISSRPGAGSLFRFEVPVEIASGDELSDSQPRVRLVSLAPDQRHPGGDPYRLLVVEDTEANRKLLVRLLRSLTDPDGRPGFDVREAANGQEAIDIWEEWRPHLIWMDLRLPQVDGCEATRRIRRMAREAGAVQGEGTRAVVIVALTATSFGEDRAQVLSWGCDDLIRKPFHETEILDVLTRHLGIRFVYETETAQEAGRWAGGARHPAHLPAGLAALPAELLDRLAQAALRIDMPLIGSLVAETQRYDPGVARTLAAMARNYDYDKILAAIRLAQRHKESHRGTKAAAAGQPPEGTPDLEPEPGQESDPPQ